MAKKEYNVDLDVKGKVLATDVPNSTGSIVTWNTTSKVFGLRTNAQIIGDLNLSSSYVPYTGATANVNLGARSITSTGGFVGNASTATKLANINTTFTGTYPLTVNVNGTIYSHTGLTYTGSTGALTANTFIGALSGNATTATSLATSRTINGTSFNGSANITTANWGTSRNITIGNTTKSVNGSANVSWSLAEIGINTGDFIPYTGANKSVNLNTQSLLTDGVISTTNGNNVINLASKVVTSNQSTNSIVLEIKDSSSAAGRLMGTYSFELFRYTGINYKFNISTYIYQYDWNHVGVTWVSGDSSAISSINLLKKSDSEFYIEIVFASNFSYMTAKVDWLGNQTALNSEFNLYRGSEVDLSTSTISFTRIPSQFTRDDYLWNKGDFSQTDINNWNTAFGWGNHALSGYLTSTDLNGYATETWVKSFGIGKPITEYNNISTIERGIPGGLYSTNTSTTGGPLSGSSGSLISIGSGVSGGTNSFIWVTGNNANAPRAFFTHSTTSGEIQPWEEIASQSWVNSRNFSTQTLSNSTSNLIVSNTIQRAALTGDVTASQNSNATTIANSAVTHAKYQNIATQRILGRGATGTGNVQELTLGANLSLSTSGVLSSSNTTYIAGTGLSLSGTTFSVNYGTSAGTSAQGNDSRIIAGYNYSQVGHLPLSGGTLTGDLALMANNNDRFITFRYANDDRYAWRVGYLGSGTGNANYFVIQSAKEAGTEYSNAIRIGLNDLKADFATIPSVGDVDMVLTNDTRINNGQTAFGWGDHSGLYVPTSRTLTAGNGLSGGGNLTSNRTFTLGTPSAITLSSTNSVTTSSHTHAFTPGGTTAQYIRGDGSLATMPTDAITTISRDGVDIPIVSQKVNIPIFSTSGAGLVPARAGSTTTKYLREDGTWVTPTNTTYSAGTLALLQEGTNTTNRVWSSKILADYVTDVIPDTSNFLKKDSTNNVTQNFALEHNFDTPAISPRTSSIYNVIDYADNKESLNLRVRDDNGEGVVMSIKNDRIRFYPQEGDSSYIDIDGDKINNLKLNGRGSLGSPIGVLTGTNLSNYVLADVSNKDALATFRVESVIQKDGIPVFGRYGASILAQTGDTMFTLSANPNAPEVYVSAGNTTNNVLWNKKLAFSVNNFTITATAFYESSLRKFKTNIKPFKTSALKLIDSLAIVTFDRIDDETKNKIGVIADDTSEEFLSEDKDAVDLYKTIFIQAKAIQELNRENKELVNKNNELEKRLERLERMLENL